MSTDVKVKEFVQQELDRVASVRSVKHLLSNSHFGGFGKLDFQRGEYLEAYYFLSRLVDDPIAGHMKILEEHMISLGKQIKTS